VTAGPGSRRWRLLSVVGVVAVGLSVLAISGLKDTLVYYRTPSEVVDHAPSPDTRFRLAGLVMTGSLHRTGDEVDFTLTDGVDDVRVVHHGDTPQMLNEGQGAVVEGTLDRARVFHSDLVMVRHSNEYHPPATKAAR